MMNMIKNQTLVALTVNSGVSPPSRRNSVTDSPLKRLVKRKKGYSYGEQIEIAPKVKYVEKEIYEENLLNNFRHYIRNLADMSNCINVWGDNNHFQCINHIRGMSDDIIGTIVQEILKYHELTPTSQKNYQMDRVQYSQALSDPNWNPKKGVQKNFLLTVAI